MEIPFFRPNGNRIQCLPERKKDCTSSSWNRNFLYDNYAGNQKAVYMVKPVINGKETSNEGSYTLPGNAPSGYIDIPLDKPADGVTPTEKNTATVPTMPPWEV